MHYPVIASNGSPLSLMGSQVSAMKNLGPVSMVQIACWSRCHRGAGSEVLILAGCQGWCALVGLSPAAARFLALH